jgi:RND family efflux transporter MFP subunit
MKRYVTPAVSRWFAALLVVVVLLALAACSSDKKQGESARETVRDVTVLAVQRASVPDSVEAVGTVRAAQSSQLAAQVMGTIVQIAVREGDAVQRGQIVAVLDDTQLRAARERAQAAVNAANHEAIAADAQYSLAQSTLKRYQDLRDKKSVSPQEFDEVNARYQAALAQRDMARAGQAQAKAALAQAQTMLDYTRIRAPFDGVITEKRVDPGTLATPGAPLLTVETRGRYRLEAALDEAAVVHARLRASVPVSVDALGTEMIEGKVVQVVPAADPASRSFLVKIELPARPGLRSGLFGRVRFPRGQRESLLVPRTAIVDRGQLQGVYVLDKDKVASLRYITLGKSAGPQVEVLSGLDSGEQIVAQPGPRELAGKRVEVQ